MHSKKFGASLCGGLLVLLLAGNIFGAVPRDRTLIDAGWRFNLGDPADLSNSSETNVAYYPEIPDLAKLQGSEATGANSETNLMKRRPDPVATHMGENVSFVATNFNDGSWRSLDLPHDWVVDLPFSSSATKNHGYKSGITGSKGGNTVGWYRRTFTLPSAYSGKTVWLEFDGVYRNSLVWLNGHIIGRNVSGYSSASFDVSKYIRPGGTNVLVVRVDASRFEGWFYEGAGIYRHVWLVKTDPIHVAHWGTWITNRVSGANGIVTIQTQVNNDGTNSATCNLNSAIYDAGGQLVGTTTASPTIAGGGNQTVQQTLTITNAQLWSLDFPNLYRLVSTVTQGGATNDLCETTFGVRTFTWDANNGLFLNGKRVEAKGVCNHQDFEGVGVAVPDRIQYYRVERLKALGFNAIRTSHNAPTPEMLDACDQLGMLVMDENRRIGSDPETLGQLQRGILRDRNHPAVFMWSLGNEEPLQSDTTNGVPIMRAMHNLARQLDPTRFCTVAMHGGWGKGFATIVEVQGGNYGTGGFTSYHSSHPTQPLITTEEGSQVGDRGNYTNLNSYVTAYDIFNPSVSWSETQEGMVQYHNSVSFVAGFFNWTGFDYRGEPTPTSWPTISSHFGILDMCGFPKDNAYYFQANWLYKPVLHLFPHWNWAGREGQMINVWCFSSCDTVQLIVNGVSQGTKTVNVESHVEWNIPYAAGTLQAIGYINGQPFMTNTITTTGPASRIVLEPDRSTITADGRDVSVVTVSIVDSQGRIVPTAKNTMTFSVTGGNIIGVGNGDPNCHESDRATNNIAVRSAFNGLAQVLIQSTANAGPVTLTATASGLSTGSATVTASAIPPVPAAPEGVVATASTQVILGWDIVPGAISYNIKRATTSGGPYTPIVDGTATPGCADANVVSGTTYYYVVSAINAAGESSDSAEVAVTVGQAFSGVYELKNGASGLVLNNQGSMTNGSAITQWTETISPNLEWTFIPTSNGYYQIRSVKSGLDVNVKGASLVAGAGIIQWSFGSAGNDQWKPVQNGDGSYTFYNLHSGMVLEDPGGSTSKTVQMDQWNANGGANQQWTLIPE